ncbi:MAG: sporulation transcription factor Spo0A [Clostridia bacterium]|nr:sporulation transcription factor Spo0A [Clostridia bacterium]
MSNIRLAIVEDNDELRGFMSQFFEQQPDVTVVGEASNGVNALKLIQETPADVMLLDMIMPGLDGFGVLAQMQSLPAEKKPQVIAVTALSRDDFIRRAVELGVQYYMIKPVELRVLLERIRDAARQRNKDPQGGPPAMPSTLSLDDKISNLFLGMGIPAHIKGYQYLREGIKLVIAEPTMISGITKELYPAIAHRFGTTSSKVERAIRHAIEVAWNRGRVDTLNKAFGCDVAQPNEKPTNGELIALIADKLRMDHSA